MAAGIALSDSQRLDWLRLIRSKGIGPRGFRSLANRFGGAGAALEALPDLARQAGRSVRICSLAEAERETEGLARLGGRFIALGEADYPRPLQAIDAAPPVLALLGDAAVIGRPALLVPYPHALDHDQAANAAALAAAGGAQVHPQSTLSPERVAALIGELMDDPARLASMAAAARSAGKPDATRLLADLTEAIASKKTVAEFRKEKNA